MKKKAYLGLYEESGITAAAFATAGVDCSFCLDNDMSVAGYKSDHPDVVYIEADLRDRAATDDIVLEIQEEYDIVFMAAFPPCTDLAVSGNAHWARKAEENPNFQIDAMDLVFAAVELGELLGCPYFIENPIGRVSTMYRKPDYKFHPYEYSGFNEAECYTKTTCLWTGGGFIMPEEYVADTCENPGKGFVNNMKKKDRRRLRSKTPKGFSMAVALANARK